MISRDPEKIFRRFVNDFPTLGLVWNSDNTPFWADAVVEYFVNLGAKEGFQTYDKNNPFLLDACWVFKSDKLPINWVEMGFESEISNQTIDGITFNFCKLIDVKAYTKVLFCYTKLDDTEELIGQLSDMVKYNPFRSIDEEYLIIAMTETEKKFTFSGFVINSSGSVLKLSPKTFVK